MFESFGFEETTAKQASVVFALALGLAFGALAQITQFCIRRGLVGSDRVSALGIWLTALAVAVIGTQVAVANELISFADHRFMVSELPVLAILLGGLMFGAGMVLTRGCVSRLTVLAGSGNLRAVTVLIVFAIVAHATLKGVLAPLRTSLGAVTVDLGDMVALSALPGGAVLWTSVLALAALAYGLRSGNKVGTLVLAGMIGLLVPLAWVGTGLILLDDFDPIAMEGLSFTSPMSETLFFGIASTSIPAGFGPGLVAGVIGGALIASLLSGQFVWQSFDSPRQTGRYALGAVLMGIGGVLAGGCSVGAGLSGIPTLSIAAILALLAIVAGALIVNAVLIRSAHVSGGPSTTPALQPAE